MLAEPFSFPNPIIFNIKPSFVEATSYPEIPCSDNIVGARSPRPYHTPLTLHSVEALS